MLSTLKYRAPRAVRGFASTTHVSALFGSQGHHAATQLFLPRDNGFLPAHTPLTQLPHEFSDLENLLKEMPVVKEDQTPGLLAQGKFGDAVHSSLKNHLGMVKDIFHEFQAEESERPLSSEKLQLLGGLYRDYAVAASCYLLEPCDLHFRSVDKEAIDKGDSHAYGKARSKLPAAIAQPMAYLADIFGMRPYMEYAHVYSLNNWKKVR